MLCEAKVLPKADRTVRAVQFINGLVPVPDHVDMRWSVVVGIHDDAQARKPQDGGHSMIVANNPNTWVSLGEVDKCAPRSVRHPVAIVYVDIRDPDSEHGNWCGSEGPHRWWSLARHR